MISVTANNAAIRSHAPPSTGDAVVGEGGMLKNVAKLCAAGGASASASSITVEFAVRADSKSSAPNMQNNAIRHKNKRRFMHLPLSTRKTELIIPALFPYVNRIRRVILRTLLLR